jgi:hypothetical protein
MDVEAVDDVVHGLLAREQRLDDAKPHRVGEGGEDLWLHVHAYAYQCISRTSSVSNNGRWSPARNGRAAAPAQIQATRVGTRLDSE